MTPVLAFILSKKVCRDVIAVDIGKNRQTTGLVEGLFTISVNAPVLRPLNLASFCRSE